MHYKNGRAKRVRNPVDTVFIAVLLLGILFLSLVLAHCSKTLQCDRIERQDNKTVCLIFK